MKWTGKRKALAVILVVLAVSIALYVIFATGNDSSQIKGLAAALIG